MTRSSHFRAGLLEANSSLGVVMGGFDQPEWGRRKCERLPDFSGSLRHLYIFRRDRAPRRITLF